MVLRRGQVPERAARADGIDTDLSDTLGSHPAPNGYSLLTVHARTENSLPDEYLGPDRFDPTYTEALLDPMRRTRDSMIYRGSIDVSRIAMHIERDSTRRARLGAHFARSKKERSDAWYWAPGVWILKNGEPIRFDWTVSNEKEVFYTVTAVQVSERVLRP